MRSACELIATATQNNPKTQEAFLATLPRLLTILNDRSYPFSVGVKAVYAVSCKSIVPCIVQNVDIIYFAKLLL